MKDDGYIDMDEESHSLHPKSFSRRDFLRFAGIAGCAVALGGGAGELLTACGEGQTPAAVTTSSLTESSTQSTLPTQSADTTTSLTSGPEAGREVKIGYVAPITGSSAALAQADEWLIGKFMKATSGFIVMADGKKHPIGVVIRDNESNVTRASQVTGDLIMNDGIDVVLGACTGELVNAIADQAEAYGAPCLTCEAPWQSYFNGRGATDPKVGFDWTYHVFCGIEDVVGMSFKMWPQVPNNKVVGALWPNDADGITYRKLWPAFLDKNGYTLVDPGAFNDGNEDFTSIIQNFKRAGVEIVSGIMSPADFTVFWKQAFQSSFLPKTCMVSKVAVFPDTIKALGEIAAGLATPCPWHPAYPYKSAITGETCQQFVDDYEASTGKQWLQPLWHFALFEWTAQVLANTMNVDDKQSVVEAILRTKATDTIYGTIDFTQQIGTGTRPTKNVVRLPLTGGQWVPGTGKWPFELALCDNGIWPDIPVPATKLKPLSEFHST